MKKNTQTLFFCFLVKLSIQAERTALQNFGLYSAEDWRSSLHSHCYSCLWRNILSSPSLTLTSSHLWFYRLSNAYAFIKVVEHNFRKCPNPSQRRSILVLLLSCSLRTFLTQSFESQALLFSVLSSQLVQGWKVAQQLGRFLQVVSLSCQHSRAPAVTSITAHYNDSYDIWYTVTACYEPAGKYLIEFRQNTQKIMCVVMRFSASSEIKEMTDPNLNIHEFAGCSKMNQNCCAFLCKSSMKQTSESKQAEKQHWNVMIKRQHQNASNRNIVHCCSYCCAHPATFVISKNKGEHSVSNNQVAETHIATMWISVRSPHMTWNDQCNILTFSTSYKPYFQNDGVEDCGNELNSC